MFQPDKEWIIINPAAPRRGKWHKLAEAIRRGCKAFPNQSYGDYYGSSMAACAMGAAAVTFRIHPSDIDCPEVLTCPIRSDCNLRDSSIRGGQLFSLVVHLNDDHRWTREDIADYLDVL